MRCLVRLRDGRVHVDVDGFDTDIWTRRDTRTAPVFVRPRSVKVHADVDGFNTDVWVRRVWYSVCPRDVGGGVRTDVGGFVVDTWVRRDTKTPGPSGWDGSVRVFTEDGDGPKRDDNRG